MVWGEDEREELESCESTRSLLDLVDFEEPENDTLCLETPLRSVNRGPVQLDFFSGKSLSRLCEESIFVGRRVVRESDRYGV